MAPEKQQRNAADNMNWPALLVNDVDEVKLQGLAGVDAMRLALPVKIVNLSVISTIEVAVLSWRWDIWNGEVPRPSFNIQVAELGGDELIGHVVSFSTLYEKLPVIAAYDMKGEEHVDTTCRPWITSEIRAWVKNPNRIIYASHMNSVPYLRLRVKPAIRWVWHTTFSETALGILFGQVGMTCLSDFKYLMPPYAQLLSMAFARMCRDDYLLTIALLSEAHRSTNSIATRVMMDIWECTFDQYNVREYTGGLETRRGEEAFDVYLGDTKVAYWICGFSLHTSREWTKLYTLPDTERSICKAIGLADAEWEEFAAKEEDRRDFLLLHLDHDIESFVDDVDSVEDYSDSVMDKMDSAVDEYTHRDTTDNQESWRVRCNVVTIKRRRSVTFRSSKQGQDSS